MKVRAAVIKDLVELTNLFNDYRVWYRKVADLEGARTFLKERIENSESVIFVAVNKEDKLAGFTQLYPFYSSTRMKRTWLLNDLFVDSAHRGLGISKLLIDVAKDHCRKTGGCAVSLETEKSNDIGNNLYPAVGFELNDDHNFYEWTCE